MIQDPEAKPRELSGTFQAAFLHLTSFLDQSNGKGKKKKKSRPNLFGEKVKLMQRKGCSKVKQD